MDKRVSICILTIIILLIACFLYLVMGAVFNETNTEGSKYSVENMESESADMGESTMDEPYSESYVGQEDFSADTWTEGLEDSELLTNAPLNSSVKYVIFARNGSLVVFYSDYVTEYFDTGIEVANLPEETVDQVVKGITFATEEELFAFLESYSS